jgi:hypothetical protein
MHNFIRTILFALSLLAVNYGCASIIVDNFSHGSNVSSEGALHQFQDVGCSSQAASFGTQNSSQTDVFDPGLIASEQCCKVCKKGQACGDSCISWEKNCHQPPGCACQGRTTAN